MNSKFLKCAGCLATMFALAACSSEENIAVDDNTPVGIEFSAGIDGTLTRAVDTSWGEGDAIGISCTSTGNTNYANKKYVTSDGSGAFSYGGTKQGIFFQGKEDVAFSAYYPFEGTDGTAIDNDVLRSRSTSAQTNSKNFDYLFASGVIASTSNAVFNASTGKYSVPVSFTGENSFKHKMSRLVLKIKADINTGMDATDVETDSYFLSNVEHEGTFNPNTGDAAAIDHGNMPVAPYYEGSYWQINATPVDGADNVRTYSMILFPQELLSLFKVRINDVDYTCQLKPINMESGKSYEYTITVKKTELAVSECSISAWGTDGESGSISIAEPATKAVADAEGNYTVTSGQSVYFEGKLEESTITINGSAYVELRNLNSYSETAYDLVNRKAPANRIKVTNGNPTIVIKGTENYLGCNGAGILIGPNASVTIKGATDNPADSKLTVRAGASTEPGIGCATEAESCKNITIKNITLEVEGGCIIPDTNRDNPNLIWEGGAAIGTAGWFGGSINDILIENSNITAKGGPGAAAIGFGTSRYFRSINSIKIINSQIAASVQYNKGFTQNGKEYPKGYGACIGFPYMVRNIEEDKLTINNAIVIESTKALASYFFAFTAFPNGYNFSETISKVGKPINTFSHGRLNWKGATYNGDPLGDETSYK